MLSNSLENEKDISSLSSKVSQHNSTDNDALSYEQQTNQITLQIRNLTNSPFMNNIDHSIKAIIPYQFTKYQYLYFIFSLGIVYIMSKISNRMYIKFRGIPCKVLQANFFLIIDEDNHYHISPKNEVSFAENQNHRDEVCENKINDFSSFPNEKKQVKFIYFTFKTNKYYHCESIVYNNNNATNTTITGMKEYFTGPTFNLSKWSNQEIRKTFMDHSLNEHGINYQRVKFGENRLEMTNTNFCIILLLQAIQPFFLIQLFNISLWIYEKYYYCYIALASLICVLVFTSYQIYTNKKKIIEFSNDDYEEYESYSMNKDTKTIEIKEVEYAALVPGQIIFLKENDVIPCDCVILEGTCSVVESCLSGESTFVMKESIPNQQLKFEYKHNPSLLFCGTKIEKVYCANIKALIIGTGFNTQRGSLIQQVLFPRKSNFRPYSDMIFYLIMSLIVYLFAVAAFCLSFYYNTKFKNITSEQIYTFVMNQLDLIAIIFPPALPLCLSLGNFFYQLILSMKNIKCCDENRLNAAGRVNKIILDKTGTLTKEDLEIYGFQTVKHNQHGKIEFETVESSTKLYSLYHLEYYKEKFHQYLMSINEGDDDNKGIKKRNNSDFMTLFLECLATCHSLNEIDGNYKGESLDLQIFNTVKWIMFSITPIRDPEDKQTYTNDKHRIIKPRNHYKITEEQFFNHSLQSNHKKGIKLKESETNYELLVLHQSAFESSKQSMHVIVKNNFDKSMRLFIKGAPEKISALCNPDSLPNNFYEKLNNLTLTGFRILACATRKLNIKEESEINGKELETDHKLTFLGLIIFRNRIKKKSKMVIKDLMQGGLNPIISTGDNAFTSISVAKDCEIVSSQSKIWTIEHKDAFEKNFIIKFSSIVLDKNAKSETYEFKYLDFTQNNIQTDKENVDNANITQMPRKRNLRRSSIFQPSNNKILEEFIPELQAQNVKLCVNSEIFRTLFIKTKYVEQFLEQDNCDADLTNMGKMKAHKLLKELVLKNAILFFRMTPTDKTNLIDLFKQDKSNIISMCGDGANDCGALNYSDIGISLKSKDSQLMTAHFMSENTSIEAINIVISIGRTCYENREILFKVILLCVITNTTHTVLLTINNDLLTNSQCLFVDGGIVLIGCIIASCSMPNFSKTQSRFIVEVLRWPFFFTIIGHSIFQVGISILYYFIIRVHINEYKLIDKNSDGRITMLNSYFFILYSIQSLSYVYIFNYFSIQKRAVVENKVFVIYLLLLLLFLIKMISIDISNMNKSTWKIVIFIPLKEEDIYPQLSRLILFGMCVLSFVGSFFYEWIFLRCLDKYIEKKMKKDTGYNLTDEEMLLLPKQNKVEGDQNIKLPIEIREKDAKNIMVNKSKDKAKEKDKEKEKEIMINLNKTDLIPILNEEEVNNVLQFNNENENKENQVLKKKTKKKEDNNNKNLEEDDNNIDIIENPEDSFNNLSINHDNSNKNICLTAVQKLNQNNNNNNNNKSNEEDISSNRAFTLHA